jgi:hypothetical protein
MSIRLILVLGPSTALRDSLLLFSSSATLKFKDFFTQDVEEDVLLGGRGLRSGVVTVVGKSLLNPAGFDVGEPLGGVDGSFPIRVRIKIIYLLAVRILRPHGLHTREDNCCDLFNWIPIVQHISANVAPSINSFFFEGRKRFSVDIKLIL